MFGKDQEHFGCWSFLHSPQLLSRLDMMKHDDTTSCRQCCDVSSRNCYFFSKLAWRRALARLLRRHCHFSPSNSEADWIASDVSSSSIALQSSLQAGLPVAVLPELRRRLFVKWRHQTLTEAPPHTAGRPPSASPPTAPIGSDLHCCACGPCSPHPPMMMSASCPTPRRPGILQCRMLLCLQVAWLTSNFATASLWATQPSLPLPLGEVAAAAMDDR